jgi:peroxiredoxin
MRLLFATLLPCLLAAEELSPAAKIKQGHSRHGEEFDQGPRERPWEMPAIGKAHFPITHKNPEVQKWFDQGNTLLHSFWDFEAERAFRWCLKLEPDNAMAWWGLARSTSDKRAEEFIKEAVKRKNTVTERERLYIEASEKAIVNDPLRDRGDSYRNQNDEYRKTLETIAVKFPSDMEARALIALTSIGDTRYATEQIIREVLAKEPDHPGAHHYRIHNWNYHEPEQSLESCRRYGLIAPGAGHALHMPGHVYATVGMWNEAAISMDSATRAEKQYMRDRMIFPFNAWNYGHNRNYLNYIFEQLAMPEGAIFGARQMMDAPLDPKSNGEKGFSTHSQGIASMLRTLVKFERWKELLDSETIKWRDLFGDKANQSYAEARAHLGLGDVGKAEKAIAKHAELEKDLEKNKDFERTYKIQRTELKARLALARGDRLRGLAKLADAAHEQFEMQKTDNDPPFYPQLLYNSLGAAYLDAKSPVLAAQAFEKALTSTRNDWFALAGLVQAYHATGEAKKAEEAMARLMYVTADADKGLAWLERARATGVAATARDSSPAPQRNYKAMNLDRFGPAVWEPYAAPKLAVVDSERKPVTLEEYRGKNVILVFYLGKECLHCLKQLRDIDGKKQEWSRLDTVVLAVSSNQPADNNAALKTIAAPVARILSDSGFKNTRRFHAYDDFEEMEIHSTILIDKKGRVHWARSGGEPFGDMEFLVKQLERMNRQIN